MSVKHRFMITGIVLLSMAGLLTSCGGGGGSVGVEGPFTNGQAAAVVIGQMDFNSAQANQGLGVAGNTIAIPYGQAFVNAGTLYLPDYGNARTLVYNSIPVANGASADFAIGQPNLTSATNGTSATAVDGPEQLVIDNGKMIQADAVNNRVIIYNTVPIVSPGTIDVVVGQLDKNTSTSGCTASELNRAESVVTAGGKLIVADGSNHRVLIWNSIPATDGVAANLVLGQDNFTSCVANRGGTAAANTLNRPAGLWSDGTRLVVSDRINHRVLVWNSIPTSNGQAADLVLGQSDFVSIAYNQGGPASASTMAAPYNGVYFNSTQLFVGDTANNRVLVWNSFPTTNGQAADNVLGQPDFATTTTGTTSTSMNQPYGVFLYGKQLIVTDVSNNRYMIYNGM